MIYVMIESETDMAIHKTADMIIQSLVYLVRFAYYSSVAVQ